MDEIDERTLLYWELLDEEATKAWNREENTSSNED